MQANKPIPPAEFKQIRLRLGLSQGAIGRLLGVSRVMVNKWETGRLAGWVPGKYRARLEELQFPAVYCPSTSEAVETGQGPDDPDNYADEAEDKATTDEERDDAEGMPVVDLWPEDDDL